MRADPMALLEGRLRRCARHQAWCRRSDRLRHERVQLHYYMIGQRIALSTAAQINCTV